MCIRDSLTNASFLREPYLAGVHRLEEAAASHDDLSPSMEPRPKEPEDAEADLRLQAVPGVTPLPAVNKGVAPPSNCPLKRPLGDTCWRTQIYYWKRCSQTLKVI